MRLSKVFFSTCVLLSTVFSIAFSQEGNAPLNIDQCVAIALEQNSQVLNAGRRVRVAETQVTTARSPVLPVVNFSWGSQKFYQGPRNILMDVPVGVDPETDQVIYEQREVIQGSYKRDSHFMRLSLNQYIFDFGATYNSIKVANKSREAIEYSFDGSRQKIILQVYQQYFQLLKDMRLIEVYEDAVNSSDEQLKRTRSMYEIGSVALADVYRAQTTLGQDRIKLIQQRNAVRNSRAALNVTLGRRADAPLDIADIQDVRAAIDYQLDNVVQIALQSNPDIRTFQSQRQAASFGVKAAKGRYMPRISGFLTYSRDNPQIDNVYSGFDKNYSWATGVNVSWNLMNGWADKANVDRQALNYRIAEENLTEQERILREQAQNAILALQSLKEILDINELNLQSAELDLRMAQERYRVGSGTLLDVIVAQASLTGAQATLVQAKYDMKIAEAQLQSIMGQLK